MSKIKDLNCKNCGQNVMVNGLKVHKDSWYCRTCIKADGLTTTTASTILDYDNNYHTFRITANTKDEILQNHYNNKL
mgnify:FL=1